MKKKYEKAYKELYLEYQNYYSTLDAQKLKPATGNLREYQLRILNLAKKIIATLEKENISYFPIGGTLIGTLRHQGFVPWDDDFDIFLFEFFLFELVLFFLLPKSTSSQPLINLLKDHYFYNTLKARIRTNNKFN